MTGSVGEEMGLDNFIEIRIDFERAHGDPTRVFRSMAELIDSTVQLDSHLSNIFSARIETSLLLQDIEAASLKSKLKTVIEWIPDEALKNGEYKKAIGHFLYKAKHRIIDWCSERDTIENRAAIQTLESEINDLAEQTDLKVFPVYAPIQTGLLLEDINSVKEALGSLTQNDIATFASPEGTSTYNKNLMISSDLINDLVTKERIKTESERLVKVKKPDYLGVSKWVIKYAGHTVEAKILHLDWLIRFQKREIDLHPGDSLRVLLRESISYGYDNEVVHVSYDIVEVIDVIPGQTFTQAPLI